jgi:hypothetical protein
MSDQKFCVDCKHHFYHRSWFWSPKHRCLLRKYGGEKVYDKVTGKDISVAIEYGECKDSRYYEMYCGANAKLFEPKEK